MIHNFIQPLNFYDTFDYQSPGGQNTLLIHNSMKVHLRRFFTGFFSLALLCLLQSTRGYAGGFQTPIQTPPQPNFNTTIADSTWYGLYTPKNPEIWQSYFSAGLAVSILPRSVIYGEVVRQFPQLTFNWRMGLPLNLGIHGQFNTAYVANVARLGLSWSKQFGSFAFSVADDVGAWYGIADLTGFNVTSLGFLNFPKLNLGINVDEYLFSVQAEALLSFGSATWLGDQESRVVDNKKEFLGTALTLMAEFNLTPTTRWYVGLKTYYSLPRFQLWLAFSEISYRVVIPEITFGYIF